MTNGISIRPSYLTAAAPAEAFAENLGFAQPARISMNNDRFNVLDENGQAIMPPSLELQVIMLWENDTRVYYTGVYDPENPSPPACYSDNKVTPSVSAMQPQNDLCATCPRAVWDQPTPRGNLVPACKNQYKVSCLVAGAKGAVFLLTIPPASRKAYEQYRKFLRSHNARPEQVITKLDYADKAFQFSYQAWINEQTNQMVKRVFETDEPALIVNAYDKPRATALPAPAPKFDPIQEEFARQVNNPQETQFAAPPKRRGRPPKSNQSVQQTELFGAAPVVSAAVTTQSLALPAQKATFDEYGFIVGDPNSPRTGAVPPAPKNNGGFGMEAAQKPTVEMQNALKEMFGP